MQAKDIMTSTVVTVHPDDLVADVAAEFLDRRISGAPVIDRNGQLVGFVSEGDLIRREESAAGQSWWLRLVADKTSEFVHAHGTRVRDVMSPTVVSIDEETSIADTARILEKNKIKRVPVLRDGRVVGIVSRADLLRALVAIEPVISRHLSNDDRQIRARIVGLLNKQTTVSLQAVSIIVAHGVVYLWGIADTETDKAAIRVAAESVTNPAKVHDFLDTQRSIMKEV